MKAKMGKVGFGFIALVLIFAQVSPAAECYFASIRNAKLVDGGTALEVIALLPCINQISDQVNSMNEDVYWVEDLSDGKVKIGLQIPASNCQIGRRFEKTIKYNLKEYNIKFPAYAYQEGILKPLTANDYSSAKQHFGDQPCAETKRIGYGNGAER